LGLSFNWVFLNKQQFKNVFPPPPLSTPLSAEGKEPLEARCYTVNDQNGWAVPNNTYVSSRYSRVALITGKKKSTLLFFCHTQEMWSTSLSRNSDKQHLMLLRLGGCCKSNLMLFNQERNETVFRRVLVCSYTVTLERGIWGWRRRAGIVVGLCTIHGGEEKYEHFWTQNFRIADLGNLSVERRINRCILKK
jgi:hypothetical protein